MADPGSIPVEAKQSKRSRFNAFLKDGLNEGLALGRTQALKGMTYLEHSVGLGHRPNVIPPDEATINGNLRLVEIGWHPVAGLGGKWFAEQTRLGKYITNTVGSSHPDPTQHWAVLVDEYVHELWMDEQLNVIYINEKINRDEWHTFHVGKTRFNDEALRQTGEMVIHNMRVQKPAYNLINNNCQTFAVAMLDAIQTGTHREFATTFAIYQTATGRGKIKDLFTDPPEEQTDSAQPIVEHQNTVQYAQQVMDQNTTRLDNHCC